MQSSSKTILILCGGLEAVEGIQSARQMSLNVVVMDGNENCPGREYANDFICGNIYDPDEVVTSIENYKGKEHLNGVITIAADNVLSVARASEYLGLCGITARTAELSSDKYLQKINLRESGLPVPWFTMINNKIQLKNILFSNAGKYILKPVDSRGARGVVRIDTVDDIDFAYSHSISFSKSNQLILEEWIDGPQLSVESLVWNYTSYLCGVADRNYEHIANYYPFVVENGGETPSRLSPDIDYHLNELLSKAAKSIGLEKGTIKADVIVNNDVLYIIEVATRLSGGFWSTLTIPKVYGIALVEEAIKIAIGDKPQLPNLPLKNLAYQSNRFIFPPKGKVVSIIKEKLNDPHIMKDLLYVKEGTVITDIDNHTKRAGMIMAVCSTREQAIESCEQAMNRIRVVTK
jgi:biotin carboxylase